MAQLPSLRGAGATLNGHNYQASLRAVIRGAWGGEGARTGVPLPWGCPCSSVCQGGRGHPIPSYPIPPCPIPPYPIPPYPIPPYPIPSNPIPSSPIPPYSLLSRPDPTAPLGSAEARQRWSSMSVWCRAGGCPAPASPSPVSLPGPAPRGPGMGGSSAGPGRDLRDDLERVPARLGTACASHSKLGHFPVHPEEHGTAASQLGCRNNRPETFNFFFSSHLSASLHLPLLCSVPGHFLSGVVLSA